MKVWCCNQWYGFSVLPGARVGRKSLLTDDNEAHFVDAHIIWELHQWYETATTKGPVSLRQSHVLLPVELTEVLIRTTVYVRE